MVLFMGRTRSTHRHHPPPPAYCYTHPHTISHRTLSHTAHWAFTAPPSPPHRAHTVQAKAVGDELVLGLIPDSEILRCKGPPVMNEEERHVLVEAVKWVDEVITGVCVCGGGGDEISGVWGRG